MHVAAMLILAGGVLLTMGDIVLKQWVQSSNIYLYVAGLTLYLVALIFLAHSFRYQNIAVASLALVVGNIVILSLVSWYIYGETLSPLQLLGIALGVASFAILEFGSR